MEEATVDTALPKLEIKWLWAEWTPLGNLGAKLKRLANYKQDT